jgi:hypothetical protein
MHNMYKRFFFDNSQTLYHAERSELVAGFTSMTMANEDEILRFAQSLP